MRTVVAILVVLFLIGVVKGALTDHTPTFHLTPAQCVSLAQAGDTRATDPSYCP